MKVPSGRSMSLSIYLRTLGTLRWIRPPMLLIIVSVPILIRVICGLITPLGVFGLGVFGAAKPKIVTVACSRYLRSRHYGPVFSKVSSNDKRNSPDLYSINVDSVEFLAMASLDSFRFESPNQRITLFRRHREISDSLEFALLVTDLVT
jgi:hypothetical protein